MKRRDELFSEYVQNSEIFEDEEKRRELLDIMYSHFFDDDYYTVDRLEKLVSEEKWKNYVEPLVPICRDKTLRILTQGNELLSTKITIDLANWLEENYQKIKENERIGILKQDFQNFIQTMSNYSERDWLELLKKLKNVYPDFGKYWQFYEKKITTLLKDAKNALNQGKERKYKKIMKKLEAVEKSLVEEYENALFEKVNKIEKEEISKAAASLKRDLMRHEEQLSNFMEILSSIFGFIGGMPGARKSGISGGMGGFGGEEDISFGVPGRFWDLSFGSWKLTVEWDVIEKYAKILEENEQIKKLAELLGRLRECEEEYEIELIEKTKIVHHWNVDSAGKSEIKGIHLSDDLNSLLPSEVTLLSLPETEVLFAKKFVEKKLLTFYYEDRYRIEKEVPEMVEHKKKKEEKKGPLIACVDTSGSMSGVPEIVAKTIILALLRIALRDERDCYLISFSTSIETLEISDMANNMDKLINFMQMGFHGGTDATPALIEALKMLKEEKYQKADVVMISDFIMGQIAEEVKENIEKQKEKKTKFHSVVISSQANPHVTKIFENTWVINYSSYENTWITINQISETI